MRCESSSGTSAQRSALLARPEKNATMMLLVCVLHSAMAGARLPESVCLQDGSVRYFAFGSNLLRSKMVGCATHQPTHDS